VKENPIAFYPNPVTNRLKIEGTELSDYDLVIHSTLGQLIENYSIADNQIDVSRLQAGVYYITLNGSNGLNSTVLKFIKK
jgi:hypothetical protein